MRAVKTGITILILLLTINMLKAEDVNVVDGHFKAEKKTNKLLKMFVASTGDIIEFDMDVNHKRKGVNFHVKQFPGNILVLSFSDWQKGTKKIVAPADVIYKAFYGGENVEFDIKVTNHTNKPDGPGLGEIFYVRIPDTSFVSGYVTRDVGEEYDLIPYTEKIVKGTTIQTDQICYRDFFTGVDILELSIPGDRKEDYQDRKLLSYNVKLVCQTPEALKMMSKLVEAGLDATANKVFDPKLKDLYGGEEDDKHDDKQGDQKQGGSKEIAGEVVEVGSALLDQFAPGSAVADNVGKVAMVVTGDGLAEMAIHEGVKAIGSDEVVALVDGVLDFKSPSDFLSDGFNEIIPKASGKAGIKITEQGQLERKTVKIPQKMFYIQSAINYGKNMGGCWDVPDSPSKGEDWQKIQAWEINKGRNDRKFYMEPSTSYGGYYQIISGMEGDYYAIQNADGDNMMRYEGNSLRLFKKKDIKCQSFRFEHLGGGKFKIYNYDGFNVCYEYSGSDNGRKAIIWGPYKGPSAEWYLIDPVTRQPFVPTENLGTEKVWANYIQLNEEGSAIDKSVKISKIDDPLYLKKSDHDVRITIKEKNGEAKGKFMLNAKYAVTDYADVVRYKRVSKDITCKDFWSAYKVFYRYDIMFENQAKEYYTTFSESEYLNSRLKSEQVDENDWKQVFRLKQYNYLKTHKN